MRPRHVAIDDNTNDDDGGSNRAVLVFRDGSQAFVNRVYTGTTRGIEAFADAVNRFLAAP